MNNRQFEVFNGRAHGRVATDEIRVTVNRGAVFYLNKAAFDVLGQPAAVELSFDGNRRIIGVKPIDPRRRNAFPVRPHSGRYRKICAAAFWKHFRLRTDGTSLFDGAEFSPDGILELPLDSMINIGRGAR